MLHRRRARSSASRALGDEERDAWRSSGRGGRAADGLEVARALGRDLALAGVPVVSGMALGIDSAAQAGALDGGGLSVAVLAGGADVPYPPSKRALHARAARRAASCVSELPPGDARRGAGRSRPATASSPASPT